MSVIVCPRRDELVAWSLGQLSSECLEAITDHLERCSHCSSLLATLDLGDDSLVDDLRRAPGSDPNEHDPECRGALDRFEAVGLDASRLGIDPDGELLDVGRAPEPAVGGRFGSYLLLELLARGGMGTVYRARHTLLNREVALKLMPTDRLDDRGAVARLARDRVGREARASEHRPRQGRGRGRGAALPGHGVRRGGRPVAAREAAWSLAGQHGLRGGPAGRARPRANPSAQHGSPRRQALEPDPLKYRPGQAPRPRPGVAASGAEQRGRAHAGRAGHGYARLHRARADLRPRTGSITGRICTALAARSTTCSRAIRRSTARGFAPPLKRCRPISARRRCSCVRPVPTCPRPWQACSTGSSPSGPRIATRPRPNWHQP